MWLQSTRDELDSFGLHLGGADGLVSAVRRGAPWLVGTPPNCAEAARQLASQRRASPRPGNYVDPGTHSPAYAGAQAPAYLPILALWVLAASEKEEGFYAKVAELIDQPFPNTPHLTNAMSMAWEDLERWSALESRGRYGIFSRRVLGEHRFVGIPRSQCLVSRRDARGIHQLFAVCGLRPGQEMTRRLLDRVIEHGRDAPYISNGLRKALDREEYLPPLQLILDKILRSWDGRRDDPDRAAGPGHVSLDRRLADIDGIEVPGAATLALAPSDGDVDGWEVRWRFQGPAHADRCVLVMGGARIPAWLEPWGGCFGTDAGGSSRDACVAALTRSGAGDVDYQIEYGDEDGHDLGDGVRIGCIEGRQMRILAWDAPVPQRGDELVECGLPVEGPAYIACSPGHRGVLERYLGNERIDWECMPANGLPEGWTLSYLPQVNRLSEAQRRWLTDGDGLYVAARLRFVGGRPIRRGGFRLYASYDPPLIEVEASSTASIQHEGIQLEEQLSDAHAPRARIRRFRVLSHDKDRLVFEVKVIDGARTVASARLRLSAPEGEGLGNTRNFSLDPHGRSRRDDQGLRGASIGTGSEHVGKELPSGPMPLQDAGWYDDGDARFHETICGRFLDLLAQSGSLGYRAARDQLARIAQADGASVEPTLLLLDLRSRGHLEVQTDDKGHLVRIHAVQPTVYPLPATFAGEMLLGVCGTLRLENWRSLLGHRACLALSQGRPGGRLPALILMSVQVEPINPRPSRDAAQGLVA